MVKLEAPSKQKKHLRIWLGMVLFLLTCFVALAYLYYPFRMSDGVFSADEFDQNVWLAKVPDQLDSTCYRGSMATDIRERIISVGMSKQQVQAVLGNPDHDTPSESRYVLGMCSGMGIDYDDLHIYFNSNGTVVSTKIIQH
jgi:outer membrane protein assembly factor BamE (lipoprotein component of BamABCDE complex)